MLSIDVFDVCSCASHIRVLADHDAAPFLPYCERNDKSKCDQKYASKYTPILGFYYLEKYHLLQIIWSNFKEKINKCLFDVD